MPTMLVAKAQASMAGMMGGAQGGDCKGCGPDGTLIKANCSVTCTVTPAVVPVVASPQIAVHAVAWLWTNDSTNARTTPPELTPPRS